MKSEIVRQFPMVELTIAALLIFFTFFVLTWLRTYTEHSKARFAELSKLPLEEGERHERQK